MRWCFEVGGGGEREIVDNFLYLMRAMTKMSEAAHCGGITNAVSFL